MLHAFTDLFFRKLCQPSRLIRTAAVGIGDVLFNITREAHMSGRKSRKRSGSSGGGGPKDTKRWKSDSDRKPDRDRKLDRDRNPNGDRRPGRRWKPYRHRKPDRYRKPDRDRKPNRDWKPDRDRERDDKKEPYPEIVKENALFEKYYQGLGLIPNGEWDQFYSTMKEFLPVTFRVTGSKTLSENVLACMEEKYFKELQDLEVEGEKIPPPQVIPWYPNRLAWHMSLGRQFLKKSQPLSKFFYFLKCEYSQGTIHRQEAVSMVPPLLLEVEPHHKVLDMCAAPGSKAAQLIEALHVKDTPSHLCPDGVVIANDADNKRCYTLVHQAKKLKSPCVMVTNCDASVFPVLYYQNESGTRLPLHYDRILCDVPCSGDGTLRKNLKIWITWNPSSGTDQHQRQLRILTRGLELLSPGGRLVYSTCSLNPVENEAVVATALSFCKGAVELVDCSDKLSGLKRCPGLTTWKVMLKNGDWIESLVEQPSDKENHIKPSMFPRPPHEMDSMHVNRCIRLLPHHQNTGGFFVAVIKKLRWLPWQSQEMEREAAIKAQKANQMATGSKQVGDDTKQEQEAAKGKQTEERPSEDILGRPDDNKQKSKSYKEDPFVFLDEDTAVCKIISKYYGTSSSFPVDRLMARTLKGKKKNVFLTSRLVKELTVRNEKDVKIISIGLRVLVRTESDRRHLCDFRIAQDGIENLVPFVSKRVVPLSLSDTICLLDHPNPLLTNLSTSLQQMLDNTETGPSLFVFKPEEVSQKEGEGSVPSVPLKSPIYLSGLVAAKSIRLYVGNDERNHFLALLGEDRFGKRTRSLATISGDKPEQKEEEKVTSEEEEKVMSEEDEKVISEEDEKVMSEEGEKKEEQPLATEEKGTDSDLLSDDIGSLEDLSDLEDESLLLESEEEEEISE